MYHSKPWTDFFLTSQMLPIGRNKDLSNRPLVAFVLDLTIGSQSHGIEVAAIDFKPGVDFKKSYKFVMSKVPENVMLLVFLNIFLFRTSLASE
jgi:hypothetical protein